MGRSERRAEYASRCPKPVKKTTSGLPVSIVACPCVSTCRVRLILFILPASFLPLFPDSPGMSRRHHDDAGLTDEVGATVAATDEWTIEAFTDRSRFVVPPAVVVSGRRPSYRMCQWVHIRLRATLLSPRDNTYVGSGRRSRIFHLTLACHLPSHSPLCRRTSSGPCRFSSRLSAPMSFPARAPFPRPLVGCLDRSENPAWRGASPIVACVQPAASPRVAVAVPPISRRCRP